MKNYISKRRKELKLTQKQAAAAVGLNDRLYQKYETGEVVPSVLAALRIAKVLHTTVEELFPLDE